MKKVSDLFVLVIFFITTFLVDRLTKLWALSVLQEGLPVPLCWAGDLLLSFNRGISCGLFHSQHNRYFYLVSGIVLLTVLAFVFVTMEHYKKQEHLFGEVLVLAGALSNITDRFFYQGVIDFIHITWLFDWPIFNIADTFIVLGVVIIFFKQRHLL